MKQLFYILFCLTVGCRLNLILDRAIAQAVSRWLPTATARVRARVRSCRICGGQSGAGARFLRALRFPLPIFIPPISPQSPSSIIWGWYNRPEVAAVPSGLSPTPLTIIIIISYLNENFLSLLCYHSAASPKDRKQWYSVLCSILVIRNTVCVGRE
jgi:hypothetical protein